MIFFFGSSRSAGICPIPLTCVFCGVLSSFGMRVTISVAERDSHAIPFKRAIYPSYAIGIRGGISRVFEIRSILSFFFSSFFLQLIGGCVTVTFSCSHPRSPSFLSLCSMI